MRCLCRCLSPRHDRKTALPRRFYRKVRKMKADELLNSCTRRNSHLGPVGCGRWAVRGTASNVCMAGTRSDRQSHRRMLRSHAFQNSPDASPQRDFTHPIQLYRQGIVSTRVPDGRAHSQRPPPAAPPPEASARGRNLPKRQWPPALRGCRRVGQVLRHPGFDCGAAHCWCPWGWLLLWAAHCNGGAGNCAKNRGACCRFSKGFRHRKYD